MNGFITFGAYTTQTKPVDSLPIPNQINLPVIAPLWVDNDARTKSNQCSTNSSVHYAIYTDEVNATGHIDDTTTYILKRAEIEASMRDQHFKPNWVLVITWINMVPWPYEQYKYSNEVGTCFFTNTIFVSTLYSL